MPEPSQTPSISLSIAAVERDTGLSKDTLRIWERRYGFPAPLRDALGERAYPLEQVERLRVVKRLLDAGHRPNRLVRLDGAALQQLAESTVDRPARQAQAALAGTESRHLLQRLQEGDVAGLRLELTRLLAHLGVRGFVADVAAPLTRAVGDSWMRGRLQIFEEHLFSELMQGLLRQALSSLPPPAPDAGPRVLLTSLPGEPHGLGLLMAEAMFALQGCTCLALGPQTPVLDIARAAAALRADVVALGFAGCLGARQARSGVAELRAEVPAATALWVGGASPALRRQPLEGVTVLDSLDAIAPALATLTHRPA